jgi:hypothetical protein
VILFVAAIALSVHGDMTQADPFASLQARLPNAVGAWTSVESTERYDPQTIFSYIDGHAEVYLAYGMRGCLARRYLPSTGDVAIVLDVFLMASSEDAYGVFTHGQEGDPISLGQGALARANWLSFWKGRFYVSVYAEDEADGAQDAVVALGRLVDQAIAEEGSRPALLECLPQEGLDPRSVRFFHDRQLLLYHVPGLRGHPLATDGQNPTVVARFHREGARALLLVTDRQSLDAARAAETAARRNGDLTEARMRVFGPRLAVVLEADTEELARSLLEEIGRRLSKSGGSP